ncbi:MAG: potassium-transporting ATPase subunit KdpC [Hadesarchaea archaeon]|nr:potassium-transporting ATPase subunit KdpC [Hadesarchaea archaeon]
MKGKIKNLSVSLRILIIGIVIFSIAYSGIIGVIGQTLWENQADGSLIKSEGEVIGSKLIGQNFDESKYFYGRPSSIDYNAMKSGSQNLGPNNPELTERVQKTLEKISENWNSDNKVPSALVTESGSALDPHITFNSAVFQIPRVSKNTGISKEKLRSLVENHSEEKLLGLFGMKRVNVLKLNLKVKRLMEEGD